MAEGVEWRVGPTEQRRIARIGQWWQRATGSEGPERHTALLIVKSTLAATIAWFVSYYLLNAHSPAFAPFSAVLIMQVTVYRSLLQAMRYASAVGAGVAVQAGLGFVAGSDLLTFALMALVALTIGRWPALGSQGSQVATAAFFAFSTYTSATSALDKITQIGEIILLVLLGCGVGILVNVAVVPPLRYRSAEHGIRTLAHALGDLVGDMHPVLREHHVDDERTGQWRGRAVRTEGLITQARAGLRTAQESLHYNPRRLFRRHRGRTGFEGYDAVLAALERVLYQVASLARSLEQWHGAEDRYRYGSFLECYADFLESVSEITRVLASLDDDELNYQSAQLCRLANQAHQCRRRVAEQAEDDGLPLADPTRPYGVLVIEATRLMQEFQYTCDVLQHHVGRR